jgi:hypothetical protein
MVEGPDQLYLPKPVVNFHQAESFGSRLSIAYSALQQQTVAQTRPMVGCTIITCSQLELVRVTEVRGEVQFVLTNVTIRRLATE